MVKIIANTEKQLYDAGAKFSESLNGGEVVSLVGDMGVGKTVFAKGMCHGLGVKQTVISPTYGIMNEYIGKYKVCHYDFYRIVYEDEAEELGLIEYFQRKDCVCIVEWGCNIKKYLKDFAVNVYINKIDEYTREVIIDV